VFCFWFRNIANQTPFERSSGASRIKRRSSGRAERRESNAGRAVERSGWGTENGLKRSTRAGVLLKLLKYSDFIDFLDYFVKV
ncbi:MAG: hypothetical protein IJE77_00980, partial [Thermoguttaceae bacterium]|nr:hypothetical protein [Thermoguttaceae bacterium]